MKRSIRVIAWIMTLVMLLTYVPVAYAEPAGDWDGFSDEFDETGSLSALTPEQKEALLNAAPLSPTYTGYGPLDTLVQQIFTEEFSADMSTYDKVRAIYAYLMSDTTYEHNDVTDDLYKTIYTAVQYESQWDSNAVCEAYGLLVTRKGVCNHFASAFTVMARALGLEAYVITCTNYGSRNGFGDHYTSAVKLEGRLYIFDPVMGVVMNDRNTVDTSLYFCNPIELESGSARTYCNLTEQMSYYGGFKTGQRPALTQEIYPAAAETETHFTFGSYPQTRVTDETLLAALNAELDPADMLSYGYYSGSGTVGSQSAGDYMRYADVEYNGSRYRAVRFTAYRPQYSYFPADEDHSLIDESGYEKNVTYWFAYEPIEWRLIDEENLLVADFVLDSQPFNNEIFLDEPREIDGTMYYAFGDADSTRSAVDWGTSDVRSWLNQNFFSTAFTAEEQTLLKETTLTNNGPMDRFNYPETQDRVFLLSRNDVRFSDYVFTGDNESRLVTGTDYAHIQGVSVKWKSGTEYAAWLLRSAGYHSGDVSISTNNGLLHCNISPAITMTGIRPAVRVTDLAGLIPDTLTQPMRVQVKATGTGEISLRSAVSSGADGYIFTCFRAGSTEPEQVFYSVSPSLVIHNLISGVNYTFTVSAYRNVGGALQTSEPCLSSAVLCRNFVSAPASVEAQAVATGEVSVSWPEVEGASLYRVYRYLDAETLTLCGESSTLSCAVSGLSADSTYWFRVSSVSADGYESELSQTIASVLAESIPARPAGLTAAATATGAITLSWRPSAGADCYTVAIHRDGGYVDLAQTQDTSYTVTGLAAGYRWYFRVTAHTADGGSVSAPVYCSADAESIPARPTGVAATATGTGAITIAWNAVEGAGSYKVWRYLNATERVLIGETANTVFTDTGRPVGYTSSYCVTALTPDGADESAVSETVTCRAVSVPEKPVNVTAAAAFTGAIAIAWDAVDGAGSYKVWRYTSQTDRVLLGETEDTSFTVTGMNVGTTYSFCVSALTPDGSSESVFSATARCACESIPAKPTGVTASPTATGAVTITWDAIPDAGNYKVWRYTSATARTLVGETENTSWTVTGLTVGTSYSFCVSALTPDGGNESSYSATARCTCASVPLPVEGLAAAPAASNALTLSWTASEGAGGYRVGIYRDGVYVDIGETADTSYTVSGLSLNSRYYFRVLAKTPDGASLSSPAYVNAVVESVPAKPTGVTAYASATRAITVAWDAVEGAGSYNVWRYTSQTARTLVGETQGTSFTVTGLAIGTSYSFCVSALTPDGGSESSYSGTAKCTCESVPAKPTGVTATATSSGAVTITWDAISGAGSYKVWRYTSATARTLVGETQDTSLTVTGLTVGNSYSFCVSAFTPDGGSESSYSATASCACESVPLPVENLAASPAASDALALSWTASAGAGLYRVAIYQDGVYNEIDTTAETSYTVNGLSLGSRYYFRVLAETPDGTSVSTPAYVNALVESVPMPVENLAASPAASDALTLSWTASAGAGLYRVSIYRDGAYNEIDTTAETSYTVRGLSLGSRYYFRVLAETPDGASVSTPAYVNALVESVPAKPTGVTAAAAATRAITIAWDPTPGAGSYKVWRYTSKTERALVGETADTAWTVTGLTVGTSYSFCVTALTSDGGSESSFSATASCACASVPAKPQGLSGATAGAGSLRLTWDAVENAGSYRVYRSVGGGEYALVGEPVEPVFLDTGLTEGTAYTYRVTALTPNYDSESVNSVSLKLTPAKTPAAPKNVTASPQSATAVLVAWSESANANAYRVYMRTGADDVFVLLGETQVVSFTADNLQPESLYGFRVVPVASPEGTPIEGKPAAVVWAQTPSNAPVVPLPPAGLTAAASGDGAITLRWQLSDGATQYNIYRYNGTKKAYVYIGTSYTDSYMASGLANGTTYYFKVYPVVKDAAGTRVGDPTAAVSAKAYATPAVPSNLTAAAEGERSIKLSWTASAGATQYNIYRYNGTKKAYVYLGTSYTASYTASGLANGTTYYFKVCAVTKGGGLTFVSAQSAAANAKAVGTPAVPANLTAAPGGSGKVTLAWTASVGATQYNVYRYNGTKKAYVYLGTSYTASYTASGLSSGTTYYFKVCAVTKGGGLTFVSALSAAAFSRPDAAPPIPTGLTAQNGGSGKVSLFWNTSAGATSYNVYRYRGDLKEYVLIGTANGTSYTASGLTAGTTYYFKVAAVNDTYVSTLSAAVNAKA